MMKAVIILTVIAACSAFPVEDIIPPKDDQPLNLPSLPVPPLGAVKPQLESDLKGPQSAPGDKTQDDLKADHTQWFGYAYPSYRRSYYNSYNKPSAYSYDWNYSNWSPYNNW